METRIAKKSRFQIVKLEERVAPGLAIAAGSVTASATAIGFNPAAVALTSTQSATLVVPFAAAAQSAGVSLAVSVA